MILLQVTSCCRFLFQLSMDNFFTTFLGLTGPNRDGRFGVTFCSFAAHKSLLKVLGM